MNVSCDDKLPLVDLGAVIESVMGLSTWYFGAASVSSSSEWFIGV